MATFARTSACITVLEKGLHSARSSLRKTKNQILDGADPRKLFKRDYQTACDNFDIMEKRILIQQRALACLSKSVAHILQRELNTMGNTGLLRREAEMTLLHPHLGESRSQVMRNWPFWPCRLFKSQLVKDGEDFLLKKALTKTLRVLDPIKASPFMVPTTIRKEAPTRNAPIGAIPPKAVTSCFLLTEENQILEAPGVIFDNTIGEEGVETLLPMTPLKPLKRNKQLFLNRVKHYHQWLCSAILLKTQLGQISSDCIQGPSKRPSSGRLYPVSAVKEHNQKGGKCKISHILQLPVSCTQASPEVEASNRPNQDLPDSGGNGCR